MLPDKKLTAQFNKFVGREVNVVETPRTTHIAGMTIRTIGSEIVRGDAAITALRDATTKAGLSLRVLLPGHGSTDDYRPNRLNVLVDKDPDGKYRIQKDFTLG